MGYTNYDLGGYYLVITCLCMFSFLITILFAFLTGWYAKRKGREFVAWFVLGLLFSPLALIVLAFMPPGGQLQEAGYSRFHVRNVRRTIVRTIHEESKLPLAGGWIMLRPESDNPRQIQLRKGDNWIGRSSECSIILDHDSVSRRHARVTYRGNGVFEITDGGSRNGTRVNGHSISRATLNDGDLIQLGDVKVGFKSARN